MSSRITRLPTPLLTILFASKIRESASLRFSFASFNVFPCVFAPGTSSTQPRYHVPLFLYTAVNCCFIYHHHTKVLNRSQIVQWLGITSLMKYGPSHVYKKSSDTEGQDGSGSDREISRIDAPSLPPPPHPTHV